MIPLMTKKVFKSNFNITKKEENKKLTFSKHKEINSSNRDFILMKNITIQQQSQKLKLEKLTMYQKRRNLWIKSETKLKENNSKSSNQPSNKKKPILKNKKSKNNSKNNNKENNSNIAKIVIYLNMML